MKTGLKFLILLLFFIQQAHGQVNINRDAYFVTQQLIWMEDYCKNFLDSTEFIKHLEIIGYKNKEVANSIYVVIKDENNIIQSQDYVKDHLTKKNLEEILKCFQAAAKDATTIVNLLKRENEINNSYTTLLENKEFKNLNFRNLTPNYRTEIKDKVDKIFKINKDSISKFLKREFLFAADSLLKSKAIVFLDTVNNANEYKDLKFFIQDLNPREDNFYKTLKDSFKVTSIDSACYSVERLLLDSIYFDDLEKILNIKSNYIKNNINERLRNINDKLIIYKDVKDKLVKNKDKLWDPDIINRYTETPLFAIASQVALTQTSLSSENIVPSSFPSQSEAVDAVAILIANRMKEEIMLTFFDHLVKFISKDSLYYFIFPHTLSIFSSNEIFLKPSLGSSWKHAFAKDLLNMPNAIKDNLNGKFLNRELAEVVATTIEIGSELKKGKNFTDVIDILVLKNDTNKSNFFMHLKMLNFLNHNLIDYNNPGGRFVAYNKFNQMTHREKKYFYLIAYNYNSDAFDLLVGKGIKFKDYIQDEKNFKLFDYKLQSLIQSYNLFERVQLQLAKNNNLEDKDKLYIYWDALIGIIENIIALSDNESQNENKIYLHISKLVIELEKAVESKNYGLLAINSVALLKEVLDYRKINGKNESFEYQNERIKKKIRKISDDKNNPNFLSDYQNPNDSLHFCYKPFILNLRNEIGWSDYRNKVRVRNIENSAQKIANFNNNFCYNYYVKKAANLSKDVKSTKQNKTNLVLFRYELNKFNHRIGKSHCLQSCQNQEFLNASTANLIKMAGDIQKDRLIAAADHEKLRLIILNLNTFKDVISSYSVNKYTHELEFINSYQRYYAEEKIDKLLNIITLFADILSASDSKQLSKIIQEKAAPVSSYKIKRYNNFSWDINSMPGYFMGVEGQPKGFKYPFENRAFLHGLTAPIGMAFSWGLTKDADESNIQKQTTFQNRRGNMKTLRGNSFTLMISLLDIGAPVAYRLFNSQAPGLPESVRIEQFFSPGVFGGFGIKNSPFIFMFGGQLNPMLRNFGDEALSSTISFSATIAVDIPLMNLTRRKRNGRNSII